MLKQISIIVSFENTSNERCLIMRIRLFPVKSNSGSMFMLIIVLLLVIIIFYSGSVIFAAEADKAVKVGDLKDTPVRYCAFP